MIGFDTETHLIQPGLLCPPLVCLSLAGAGSDPPAWLPAGALRQNHPDAWLALLDRPDAVQSIPSLLRHEGGVIGHNTPYDLAVVAECHRVATGSHEAIRLVFEGLTECRTFDTKIRETLLRIATGELKFTVGPDGIEKSDYSLAALVHRYLGVDISETKTDPNAWRLRYRELDGVPLDRWPKAAVDYAILDAYWPLRVADAQVANDVVVDGFEVHDGRFAIVSESREVAAAFALHLGAIWGMRTDRDRVDGTIAEWKASSEDGIRLGERLGFIRVKGRDKGKAGSIDKKKLGALVSEAYHGSPPMTDPSATYPAGQIRTAEEVLKASGHLELELYSKSIEASGFISRSAPILVRGVEYPITYGVNSILTTGRASIYKPPMQQPPRSGGFRGCFVPRPGWLFASADYDFIELCSVSQVCLWQFGQSALADTINAGVDPHISMAWRILRAYNHPETPGSVAEAWGRRKEPLIKEHRQLAKAANFGLWGGLGPDTFVEYARSTYDITTLSLERAADIRDIWKEENPEAPLYFQWVADALEHQSTIQQFVSGRVRGDVRFTSACNSFFQGLTADGAKYAYFMVAKACYTEPESPLYGCRVVLFLHDEIIIEAPEERAADAAIELARVMIAAMKEHVTDVRIGAKPVLTRNWMKGADPTYRDGRLVVTEEAV